jgi:uncharacterized protein (DUF2235 family)
MPRRLCVLFDGTWNNRHDATNVTRMRASILSRGRDDPEQPVFYDAGVGTHWYDRLTGGAFGRGLSENIRQGHAWVSQHLGPDDQLFLFGFSRGAYTARSLVGLIRKCGLLNDPSPRQLAAAHDLYREKRVAPDDPEAVAFRARHSRETRVRFIGVWDTVGALGIPLSHVPFSRDYYRWHDTELSKIVDHACHAMAVDERRADYDVTRWTQRKPGNLHVEQRWFVGAHANVGGGYDKSPPDPLPNAPLRWLQDQAEAAGLVFRDKCAPGPDDHLAGYNDSFAEFMFGVYRLFKKPHERVFGTGVHETVDDTVWARWRRDPSYRPPGLAQHPDRPLP